MRSSASLMSLPCAASMASENLNASVPNFSIMTRGSMTFPLLLLIFWPFASLMSAWM